MIQKFLAKLRPCIIEHDIEKHGDLLWADFSDTYINLSFKTLSIIMFHHSLNATWDVPIFVTDDDVMVFVTHLAQLVRKLNGTDGHIVGHCWNGAKPIRDPKHKK